MTRTLTITPADPPIVPGIAVFLVRSQECSLHEAGIEHGPDYCDMPMPVEFVQACAPCARCKDTRVIHAETFPTPCPYCRIELVGPCPECVKVMSDRDKPCTTVTLGHAYAIGQPLPIDWAKSGHSEPFVGVWKPPYPPTVLFLAYDTEGIPIDLAHYGPPDTLVDRWAIQLRVVQ